MRETAKVLLGRQLDIGGFDSLYSFQDAGANFAGFRVPAHFLLGEDQLAIDPDIEDSTGGRYQLPTADVELNVALLQNFVRQTDGIGLVPSSRAVLDDDLHSTLLHGIAPFLPASSDDKHPYLKLPCGVKKREATAQAAVSLG